MVREYRRAAERSPSVCASIELRSLDLVVAGFGTAQVISIGDSADGLSYRLILECRGEYNIWKAERAVKRSTLGRRHGLHIVTALPQMGAVIRRGKLVVEFSVPSRPESVSVALRIIAEVIGRLIPLANQ